MGDGHRDRSGLRGGNSGKAGNIKHHLARLFERWPFRGGRVGELDMG